VTNDGRVTAQALSSGGAQPGDQVVIQLQLQADGLLTEPVEAEVVVRVVPSTLPLAQAVDDVEPDGRSSSVYSIPVLENDFNPYLVRPERTPLQLEDVQFEGDPLGASVQLDRTAGRVTVTTGPTKSGTVTLVYTISDGSNEQSRTVQGRIVITVTSAPEPPTVVGAPSREGSQSLGVTFAPPSSWNGSPELNPAYVVTAYVGSSNTVAATRFDCTAGVKCVFTGLTNGTSYSFQVVARNGVGETASVRSATEIPYGLPSAPTNPTLSPNGATANAALTGTWGASAQTGGGAVTYSWRFVAGSSTAGSTGATTAGLGSFPAGSYRFEVRACNAGGLCSGWVGSNTVSVIPAPRIIDIARGADYTGSGCAFATCSRIRVVVENLAGTRSVCLYGRAAGSGSAFGWWADQECFDANFSGGFADTEFLLNKVGNVGAFDVRVTVSGVSGSFDDRIW